MLAVLYVDDEPALLEIGKIFLEADGSMAVDTACSAQAALPLIRQGTYHAVVSDYEMPFINGIKLLKTLRAEGNTIPFIVFTGKGREEIMIEAFNSGADDYIQKGGNPRAQFAELSHKIKTAVERRKFDGALEQSDAVLREIRLTNTGFLAADRGDVISAFNQKFVAMGNIPAENAKKCDGQSIFALIDSRIANSHRSIRNPLEVALNPKDKRYDTRSKKAGRKFYPAFLPGILENGNINSRNRVEMMSSNNQPPQVIESPNQDKKPETNRKPVAEEEDFYRSIAGLISDGICICNGNTIIDANEQFADVFGITQKGIIRREITEFITSDLRERIADLLKSGSTAWCQSEICKNDGTSIQVLIRSRTIIFRGISAWVSVWHRLHFMDEPDIGHLESEEKYRNVFRAENSPLLLIDQESFAIEDLNDAACQTYGYFRNELIGRGILDLYSDPEKALKDIRKKRPGVHPYYHRRKDGSVFPADVSTAFFSLKGRPVFVNSVRDMTKTKKMEEMLKLTNIKLNLLLGITRHDVLNKLTVLMAYNELISNKTDDPEIRSMLEGQRKTTHAIQRQIDFTREYENLGVKGLRWQRVDEIIARTQDHFLKTIRLTVNVGDLEVYADPLIEKVFYNLFDNAFRYGEGISEITVSNRISGEKLEIIFEDNGIGIPTEEKEKIFYQGYGKNSGLGLFLSREILSITGMSIRESGEFRKGARFEIGIPSGSYRTGGEGAPHRE